jgi:ParB family chromosome partitioning protein
VVVRPTEDEDRLEVALIENLQRADLNPIEEARAFAQLMELRGYNHEELGARVGKDRSTVSNAIRLLGLPEKVQQMVIEGRLSMGHARALLGLDDSAEMIDLAHQIIQRKLSVRATEAEVRKRLRAPEPTQVDDETRRHAIIVKDLEERLRRTLGARVRLKTGRNKRGPGKIEVSYADLDELNRILHVMMGHGGET